MSTTISSNMNLIIPGVGTENGPAYATDINNSLTIIDQHDHTSGKGIQITPAALNINTSLSMGGQSLINTAAVSLQAQSSDPISSSIYEKGVDLYYRDGGGNVIRLTQSGSIVGTAGSITGLPSGTASASFGAGTFVFQSATLTAANIDGGSLILRNSTASSKGLTLQPPNAMGANYSLTLPSLPGQTNVMTLSSVGSMGSVTYDSVGQSMTAAGANAIAATRTRPTGAIELSTGGIGVSPSLNFSTISTTYDTVTNSQIVITSSGKPVFITVTSDTSGSDCNFTGTTSGSSLGLSVVCVRDGSVTVGKQKIAEGASFGASALGLVVPGSSVSFVDFPTAGQHSYVLAIKCDSGTTGSLSNAILVAYEL